MSRIFLVFMSLFSSAANSGGASWQIAIDQFERVSELEAKATVGFLSDSSEFQDCDKIEISFKFDHEKAENTSLKNFLSPESQRNMLDRIEKRSKQIKPIMMLGAMGNGLKKESQCRYISAGLAELDEHNGRKAIYSFYNPV